MKKVRNILSSMQEEIRNCILINLRQFNSEVKTSTVSSNGRDVQDDIEKKLSDLYPNFGIDLNIIENSDENGMKFAFNIRKVSLYNSIL